MATSIELDDRLEERVQQLASRRRRSAQGILREAFQQRVEREESRESFKQETLAAWAAYQETGLHLTGEELDTWLERWGTEAETELPECHR